MERPFSLYADLRVPPDAPPAAIEAAYRRLMKRYHPDHAGAGSAGRAAEINAAFSVLRSPERRSAYDRREHAREHARQHAAYLAETQRRVRQRRVVRASASLAAAIALGAGIPLAANWYDGGIVRERSAAIAAVPPQEIPVQADEIDPAERVAEFLAKAAIGRPALRVPAPPKPNSAESVTPARAAAAIGADVPARVRRSAPERAPVGTGTSSRSKAAEPDFLEREGFIY